MKIRTCPSCGRRALRAVSGPARFRVRRRIVTIPDVPRLVCDSCGEQLFDREANRIIDAHARRRLRGAA